jgi:hypothetical protein
MNRTIATIGYERLTIEKFVAAEGTSEAIIFVKASPQVGKRHGETVCCAGVNDKGEWVRLYPINFRTLDQARQFRRWDRICFRWKGRRMTADPRVSASIISRSKSLVS